MPMPRNRGGGLRGGKPRSFPAAAQRPVRPRQGHCPLREAAGGLTALGCLLPALGVDGEDGQILTAPAPDALAGIDSTAFGPARIRVHVTGPGREQAAGLATAIAPRGPPAEATGAVLRCWRWPNAGRPPRAPCVRFACM